MAANGSVMTANDSQWQPPARAPQLAKTGEDASDPATLARIAAEGDVGFRALSSRYLHSVVQAPAPRARPLARPRAAGDRQGQTTMRPNPTSDPCSPQASDPARVQGGASASNSHAPFPEGMGNADRPPHPGRQCPWLPLAVILHCRWLSLAVILHCH